MSIPAPPENSAPGFYFQQLQSQRSDPYCDKVLSCLDRVCSEHNIQSDTIKEAILRLFALSVPMAAKDPETELLLQLLDHFKVEMEKND